MSRRAFKGINWSAIAERISESDKNIYASFKSKSDQYLQRVMELPEAPIKIDWAYYKQHVPIPGMVDKFQKEYESLKIPYPPDNYTSIIAAEGQQALDDVKTFTEESNQRIANCKAEIEKIQKLMPFDQMTMEDYAEAFPEQALNIDVPTIWPHIPEDQPDDREVATPIPKPEH